MASHTRVVVGFERSSRNEGTRVARTLRNELAARWLAPDEVRERWQEVLERIHLWRAEHPEGDALAVVVRDGDSFDVSLTQSREGPSALIVGRHTNCDLVLAMDGAASLRHAAVLLWPSTSTSPARAIAVDLRSELGLILADRRVTRRLSSTKAWAFSAGGAEVTALVASGDAPFSVRWADQLDAELSGALVDVNERLDPSPSSAQSAAWERSVVVRTRLAGIAPPVVAEETLAIRATRPDVERGVVLGRYARCDRTTALAGDENVSRVHALLFSAAPSADSESALWVVDTASTGGTDVIGPSIDAELGEGRRIVRLPPDARLFLAGVETLLVVDG